MGLPLAPTFANVFLCYHETQWLKDCPPDFSPVYYRRYVGDIFVLFRDKSHSSLFLNYLNSKHKNINFTMETEEHNRLSFLDTLVFKSNKFNTSVLGNLLLQAWESVILAFVLLFSRLTVLNAYYIELTKFVPVSILLMTNLIL